MIHRRAFVYLIFLVLLTLVVEPQELRHTTTVSSTDSVTIPLPAHHHAPSIYAPLSPAEPDMHYDLSPSHPRPERIESVEFRFYLPRWNVYRRSVTLWGISFSTGHAPSGVPSGADASAEVLSFPLTAPR